MPTNAEGFSRILYTTTDLAVRGSHPGHADGTQQIPAAGLVLGYDVAGLRSLRTAQPHPCSVEASRMAYAPGFDIDVFISYAHKNNENEWVTRFHEFLAQRVPEFLEHQAQVSVWRDQKLNGFDQLWPTLQQKIESSALLLSICSPVYVTSANCAKEVEHFLAHSRETSRIDRKSRLARLAIIPYAKCPRRTPVLPAERHRLLLVLRGATGRDHRPVRRRAPRPFARKRTGSRSTSPDSCGACVTPRNARPHPGVGQAQAPLRRQYLQGPRRSSHHAPQRIQGLRAADHP